MKCTFLLYIILDKYRNKKDCHQRDLDRVLAGSVPDCLPDMGAGTGTCRALTYKPRWRLTATRWSATHDKASSQADGLTSSGLDSVLAVAGRPVQQRGTATPVRALAVLGGRLCIRWAQDS
jgi:hypothetical protein